VSTEMHSLSKEEILFFKTNGYLIKRDVLDPELMARARDKLWEGAPSGMKRDEPSTWIGPFKEEQVSEETSNVRKGFGWNYREPGGLDWMIRLLATDPSVWHMVEQMLGEGQLQTPDRIRGIYCAMPRDDTSPKPYGCHVDAHPFHLGVVGYIDYVAPDGGGFNVWPGSHKKFYYDNHSQYANEPTEEYAKDRDIVNKLPRVDCHGGPGDIVFWHHRIGHSQGINLTRQIRKAVLYDFRKLDLDETQKEPPCSDMWRDWSQAVRDA